MNVLFIYSVLKIINLKTSFIRKLTLKDLDIEKQFVFDNHHLKGIPSGKEIEKNGLDLSEMLSVQMRKIEQLYLYMFLLKEENENLKKRISELESK